MLSFKKLCVLVFLLISTSLYAYTITGHVVDKSDGTPIQNANVTLVDTQFGAATSENGTFQIDDVPAGSYIIAASHIGYGVSKIEVEVSESKTNVTLKLQPDVLKGQEIMISANRAVERKSPVAFTDISAKEIEQKYWAQEVPLLLDEVPGVYSYSYTGGGLGYSEVKIRGFDATRVGVTINGVPLNDPEDHITYFYDLPDISANVQDIQVQRGVANSLYGTGAFAGSVNLQTTSSGQKRQIQYSGGFGSYNTRKHTVTLSSGLVNNTYTFFGRFSKVNTDGYRDRSWVDAWSYFFSASRYDKNFTTTINLFGGPMRAHFAWYGITKEELKKNRTLNYNTYPDAADNFHQPHYQLINKWTPNNNLNVQSTLFYVKGDGYYEQYKQDRLLSNYNMSSFEENSNVVEQTDLVQQKKVDKQQVGWIPRVNLDLGAHDLSAGGEFSFFSSKHWGEVKWGRHLPPGTSPNLVYYRHNGVKNTFALFINDLYELRSDLFLKVDLQYKHITNAFDQKKMGAFIGHEYTMTYDFLTPRIGLNYNINENWNIFGNYSMANREPKDNDIYDADNPLARPLFRTINVQAGVYNDPYIKHETLHDFELGGGYKSSRTHFDVNLFWMNFRNEIVPTGGITDDGYPIYGNADRSVHRGVELDFRTLLPANFSLSANATFSDNYFVDYIEYLWNENYTGHLAIDRSGNIISGFPRTLANSRINKQIGDLTMSLHGKHVGRIYLDNSENKDLSIDPHFVLNLSARTPLPDIFKPLNLSLSLYVNNVLNAEYEVSGYAWGGVGYYIPAALRNYYLSVKATL